MRYDTISKKYGRERMPNQTLRVIARMIARPDKVEELRQLLMGLPGPTRQEAGCISYECLQNRVDMADFTFVEEWQNDEALDAHLQTPHLQYALSKLPSLVATEPDIRRYSLLF
jgi:quinol monooxygenase YgiN